MCIKENEAALIRVLALALLILLASFGLHGCASNPVGVPIATACLTHDQIPAKPELVWERLEPGAKDLDRVKALISDREFLKVYSNILEDLLTECVDKR